jgi:hypothetical protein
LTSDEGPTKQLLDAIAASIQIEDVAELLEGTCIHSLSVRYTGRQAFTRKSCVQLN